MEISDLYRLPKDMLVKLILTIQDDLKKEIDVYKDILDKIREKFTRGSVDMCSYKRCHRYFLFEESIDCYDEGNPYSFTKDLEYRNDGRLEFCNCMVETCCCEKDADRGIGWWCIEHLSEGGLTHIKGTTSFICEKCLDHYYRDNSIFDPETCQGCKLCVYEK